MKVLVIPEDQELDQYIVKPAVQLMLKELDVTARVDVLPEPRLRGASEALDRSLIAEIVRDNPMIDLFLLLVDRDCDREGNEQRAREREAEHPRLLACCAWQEVEVWLLSAYKDRLNTPWATVRQDCDPKESFAEPLLNELGTSGPGRGRKAAMSMVRFDDLMTCSELRSFYERLRERTKR